MNHDKKIGQEDPKNVRPPEYVIIHRSAAARSSALQQPRKTRQSKKESRFDQNETKREQQREARYKAQRRKQWILAAVVVVGFITALGLAAHFLTNTSNNATSTPNTQPPLGTPASQAAFSVRL